MLLQRLSNQGSVDEAICRGIPSCAIRCTETTGRAQATLTEMILLNWLTMLKLFPRFPGCAAATGSIWFWNDADARGRCWTASCARSNLNWQEPNLLLDVGCFFSGALILSTSTQQFWIAESFRIQSVSVNVYVRVSRTRHYHSITTTQHPWKYQGAQNDNITNVFAKIDADARNVPRDV